MKSKYINMDLNYELIKTPLVSIIVPVYGVEEYIRRCIDSILSQTYKNFELILVDDGSVDLSGQLCEDFLINDERIVLIHNNNRGQGCARNIGLEAATGDYITFVDSDDYIHKDYIYMMLLLAEYTQADIVQSKINITYKTDLITDNNINKLSYYMISGKSAPNTYEYKVAPCAKLYKKFLLKDIRFGRWKVNEDDAIYYRIAYGADKVCISDVYLYNYYQSPNSVMRNSKKDKLLDYIDIYYERIYFYENNDDKLGLLKTRDRFCLILILNYINYVKNKTNSDDLKRMLKIFKEEYAFVRVSENVSIVRKFIYGIFNIIPDAVSKLAILFRLV